MASLRLNELNMVHILQTDIPTHKWIFSFKHKFHNVSKFDAMHWLTVPVFQAKEVFQETDESQS